jgi:hypothetical protein
VCRARRVGVVDVDNSAPEFRMLECNDTRKTPDRRLGDGEVARSVIGSAGCARRVSTQIGAAIPVFVNA